MIPHPIYLDYQATTPVSAEVLSEMENFYLCHFANTSSHEHYIGQSASQNLNMLREKLADLLGCHSHELIFTSGATESANIAINSLSNIIGAKKIIFSPFEHKAVLEPLLHYYPRSLIKLNHKNGYHHLDSIDKLLKEDCGAAIIMAVNNEIGTIHQPEQYFEFWRSRNIISIVDFTQAIGKIKLMPINQSCDIGFFSAHKYYGPKGIGVLYVKENLLACIKPVTYGGRQELGIRPGTVPLPLIAGLVKATELALANFEQWNEKIVSLNTITREYLNTSGIRFEVNGPKSDLRVAHNINIRLPNISFETLIAAFPTLCVSSGAACSSSSTHNRSHVLEALGLNSKEISESFRFGLSHLIDPQELTTVISYLVKVVQRLT